MQCWRCRIDYKTLQASDHWFQNMSIFDCCLCHVGITSFGGMPYFQIPRVAEFAGGPAGVSAVVALRSQGRPWAVEFRTAMATMLDGDDSNPRGFPEMGIPRIIIKIGVSLTIHPGVPPWPWNPHI